MDINILTLILTIMMKQNNNNDIKEEIKTMTLNIYIYYWIEKPRL